MNHSQTFNFTSLYSEQNKLHNYFKELLDEIYNSLEFEKSHFISIFIKRRFGVQKIPLTIKTIKKYLEIYKENISCLKEHISRSSLNNLDKQTCLNLHTQLIKNIQEFELFIQKYNEISVETYFNHKKIIIEQLKNSKKQIEDIELLLETNTNFMTQIEFQDVPLISNSNIKKGDIIVYQINSQIKKPANLFISKILNSKIIHASIVYSTNKNSIFIFETSKFEKNYTTVKPFVFEKGFEYFILRNKNSLTKQQLLELNSSIEKYTAHPYGTIKTVAILDFKIRKFISSRLKISKGTNPFNFTKGMFCSELVCKIYDDMGIKLAFNNDSSMIFPYDLINSKKLYIAGKLDTPVEK